MVSYIKPIKLEISAPTAANAATNVSGAHDVRVVNAGSTARLLTISTASHTDSASMTIAANEMIFSGVMASLVAIMTDKETL